MVYKEFKNQQQNHHLSLFAPERINYFGTVALAFIINPRSAIGIIQLHLKEEVSKLTLTLFRPVLINKIHTLFTIGSNVLIIIEPRHEIFNNVVCATSKASDQTAHMRSLIRAFTSRLSIL